MRIISVVLFRQRCVDGEFGGSGGLGVALVIVEPLLAISVVWIWSLREVQDFAVRLGS